MLKNNKNIYLIFIILGLLFYFRALLPNKVTLSHDQLAQNLPLKHFEIKYWRTHLRPPFWNPFIYSGMPYIESLTGDIFYPITIILKFIFQEHKVLVLGFLIHLILMGIFTFNFLTSIGIKKEVSFLFGLSMMFSGYYVSLVHPGHDGKAYALAWLPFIFWMIYEGYKKLSMKYFLLGGIGFGFAILSPHIQIVYFIGIASLLWAIFLLIDLKKRKERKHLAKFIFGFILLNLIGVLISLIQFLPSFLYVIKKLGFRGVERGYEYATSWSFPPEEIFDFFVPQFCGLLENYWARNFFRLHTDYFGLLVVVLSISNLIAIKRIKKRENKFFWILFLIFFIYSLGKYTPIFKLFYYLVPLVKKFRGPRMMLIFPIFSLNILSAIYLNEVLQKRAEDKPLYKSFLITIAIIILIFLLSTFLKKPLEHFVKTIIKHGSEGDIYEKIKNFERNLSNVAYGSFRSAIIVVLFYLIFKNVRNLKTKIVFLSIVLIFDLWTIDFKFLKIIDYRRYTQKDTITQFLISQKREGDFRVMYLYSPEYMDNNYFARWEIENTGGNHPNPLKIYQTYCGNTKSVMFRPDRIPNLLKYPNLIDMLNVRFIITYPMPKETSGYPEWVTDIRKMLSDTNHFKIIGSDGRNLVYENLKVQPRLWEVKKVVYLENNEKILNKIKTSYSCKESVFVYGKPHSKVYSGKILHWEKIKYTADYRKLLVNASDTIFIVFSEVFHPYWKIYIDGKQAKIYRTNFLFTGIEFPKGKHVIEFKYKNPFITIGFLISITTLIVSILFIFLAPESKRRQKKK